MRNEKQTLYSRLVRHGVPDDIANALVQSGLLTYEQSRSVTGKAIKEQAINIYESATNKATVRRVLQDGKTSYSVETKDGTEYFSSLKEVKEHVWLQRLAVYPWQTDKRVFYLCAYGEELHTLTRPNN